MEKNKEESVWIKVNGKEQWDLIATVTDVSFGVPYSRRVGSIIWSYVHNAFVWKHAFLVLNRDGSRLQRVESVYNKLREVNGVK